MPIPANELPVFTVMLNLPAVQVTAIPLTSQAISVPVGVREVRATLDGSSWPANTAIAVTTEISQNAGATWQKTGGITASSESLLSGKCSTGILFNGGSNQNVNCRLRATIAVTSGAGITLAGTISTS